MLVDLSVGIEDGMAKIPFLPDVHIEVLRALADARPLEIRNVSMATHIGTHIDTAAHAFAGAATIDEVRLDAVCGPGVEIRVAARPNEPITLAHVRDSGPAIEHGDLVLLDTGFAKYGAVNEATRLRVAGSRLSRRVPRAEVPFFPLHIGGDPLEQRLPGRERDALPDELVEQRARAAEGRCIFPGQDELGSAVRGDAKAQFTLQVG